MKTIIKYRVPYADTDQMQVVYYANYYIYFELLRNELLRELDLPYKKLEEEGIMFPVTESFCKYVFPAKYDDLLEITGEISEAKKVFIKIICKIYCEGKLLAEGYTIHAAIDAKTRKITKIPTTILEKLNSKQ